MLRLITLCFAWTSISYLLAAEPMPKPKAVDVWLLSGQSNMQGNAKIKDIPQDVPRQIKHAFLWNGKEFEPLNLGQTKSSTRADEFGPEIGFALETASAERPVYLIKYAASGMPLHHGWNGASWVGGEPEPKRVNFYPGIKSDDPNQGTLYATMIRTFRAGLRHLKQQGQLADVRGMLWMQGEADAKAAESATTYDVSLKRLRERVAGDLQASEKMPLVFGQVLPHEPALARFTHRTEIRAMMSAVDAKSGKPQSDAHIRMVSTDGFGIQSDTVHFDAAGQLKLGRSMGQIALEMSR